MSGFSQEKWKINKRGWRGAGWLGWGGGGSIKSEGLEFFSNKFMRGTTVIWGRRVENKRKKKKHLRKKKKKNNPFFCYFISLSKKHFFVVITFRGKVFWRKASSCVLLCILCLQNLLMASKLHLGEWEICKHRNPSIVSWGNKVFELKQEAKVYTIENRE